MSGAGALLIVCPVSLHPFLLLLAFSWACLGDAGLHSADLGGRKCLKKSTQGPLHSLFNITYTVLLVWSIFALKYLFTSYLQCSYFTSPWIVSHPLNSYEVSICFKMKAVYAYYPFFPPMELEYFALVKMNSAYLFEKYIKVTGSGKFRNIWY